VAISTVRYKKPPVIERALTVHVNLSEEAFALKMDSWKGILQEEFPHSEILTEWTLGITEKHGMPVLDPARQTITLRQTFWKMANSNQKDHGMQLWKDRISFNLLGTPGNPRQYKDLQDFVGEWSPRWAAHFGIDQCTGVTLQYVNLLSEVTLPSFIEGRTTLKLGEVLTIFRGLPNPTGNLVQSPFNLLVNMDCKNWDPPARFAVQCNSAEAQPTITHQGQGVIPILHLHFIASSHLAGRTILIKDVPEEARAMHDLIVSHFEAYFTDAAKASFEPC